MAVEKEEIDSWHKVGMLVLSEIQRLSTAIDGIVKMVAQLNQEMIAHNSWAENHEKKHEIVDIRLSAHTEKIQDINKYRYILYGIIIATGLFISGGIITYFVQH